MSFLAAASIGLGVGANLVSGISSLRQASRADRKRKQYEKMLSDLENNRQEVINPYANVTNPFENLGVATGAAEMRAEETDISLANTLDTMRASGYGAGGATALAQAASRAKQDIANSIEAQETRNMELRARGQQEMERMQGYGREFQFRAQEARENQLLNRYAGMAQENQRLSAMSRQNAFQSFAGAGSNLAQAGMGYFSGMNTEYK